MTIEDFHTTEVFASEKSSSSRGPSKEQRDEKEKGVQNKSLDTEIADCGEEKAEEGRAMGESIAEGASEKLGEIYHALLHPDQFIQSKAEELAKKALKDFVLEVEPVSNQVVVKTTTAAATVIAESIDNLYMDNIVASIAGDNVVLIISADETKAKEVAKTIEGNIK